MQMLCVVWDVENGVSHAVDRMYVETDHPLKACEAAYVATNTITKAWADTGERSTRKGDRITVDGVRYDVLSVGFLRAVENQNDGQF